MVTKGLNKIVIQTVDTDVVKLVVAVLAKIFLNELWIAFNVRMQFQYIAAYHQDQLPLIHLPDPHLPQLLLRIHQ